MPLTNLVASTAIVVVGTPRRGDPARAAAGGTSLTQSALNTETKPAAPASIG